MFWTLQEYLECMTGPRNAEILLVQFHKLVYRPYRPNQSSDVESGQAGLPTRDGKYEKLTKLNPIGFISPDFTFLLVLLYNLNQTNYSTPEVA